MFSLITIINLIDITSISISLIIFNIKSFEKAGFCVKYRNNKITINLERIVFNFIIISYTVRFYNCFWNYYFSEIKKSENTTPNKS